MKRTLIVGNWKMHLNVHEASLLVKRLDDRIQIHRDLEVVLAPSLVSLQPISLQIDRRKFRLAAQNAFYKDEGAYTGEVSFTMLNGLVHYVIVGHSERRRYFHETLDVVCSKVQAAVRNDIVPILCVGETAQERAAGEARQVVHDQVTTALANLTPEEIANVVIAYEPAWAIGTGDPAKPDDIVKIIRSIQRTLEDLYGSKVSEEVRLLYGASVAPEFVSTILKLEGIHGLLVGGASLNYHQFSDIVQVAYRLAHERDESHAKK